MFHPKLDCRRIARGAAFLALCLTLWAPPARADDQWSDIRSDYRDGRFQSALERLDRLVARDPHDREAYYYLGLINWRTGNYPAAAVAYRHVITLDPDGPFGEDARLWLASYGSVAAGGTPPPTATPVPEPEDSPGGVALPPLVVSPLPSPEVLPSPPVVSPSKAPRPRPSGRPRPRPVPSSRTPWLQIEPHESTTRPRGMNARPGYFKAADGTFEFVPPKGFVLLDEGIDGTEWHVLFGPAYTLGLAGAAEQPPTLLVVWRELPELQRFKPDQRAARERQLLAIEAATYGPGAKPEARYGGPTFRVDQRQGEWAARTLLFFKNDRLYAVTYGGDATLLPKYAPQVDRSLGTPIFYP